MKKRLNIFCVCMIAAFLLSVSGNVYLIIEMFVNGVEVGMKAAQGEITEIPQYKMVHVLPTDMMETTGTVTNLKDGITGSRYWLSWRNIPYQLPTWSFQYGCHLLNVLFSNRGEPQ